MRFAESNSKALFFRDETFASGIKYCLGIWRPELFTSPSLPPGHGNAICSAPYYHHHGGATVSLTHSATSTAPSTDGDFPGGASPAKLRLRAASDETTGG